ncbi:MAG TPA: hypothetical protein PLJ71_17510 [Candidatus Hydrogenedentes bacterium]|nr:hypothetical protein [Candidatus Hydrogenedentota bacterium]
MNCSVIPGKLLCVWVIVLVCGVTAGPMAFGGEEDTGGELLYNGIRLPEVWPPDRPLSREPMPVPYLENPPEVIPIDVGRQLFVDDFLVAETSLARTHHAAEYWPENPVLAPDKAWESDTESQGKPAPTAMPFSDGVWYDPAEQLFKMWYMGGYVKTTCYATSKDGIHWEKPLLDVVPDTNIVQNLGRDSNTIWLDLFEKDPAKRYKMFAYLKGAPPKIFWSSDGIHWGDPVAQTGPMGDRSTMFYNPFRKVWVYGIRDYPGDGLGRFRRYHEHADFVEGAKWEKGGPPFWVGADTLDPPRADLNTPCELYNLDAAAYESVIIGMFDIWRGQPKDRAKPNELCIGYTRDGFHWYRPTHEPFISVSEHYGDWNWGNVQSAGGCCLVIGDKLYFYVSGRRGVQGFPSSGVCATGLATLRRDGFVSMDAGEAEGILLTRPVRFSGKRLFVNAKTDGGELRVEVCDVSGVPQPGFMKDECVPVTADSTCGEVAWKSGGDLAAFAGKPVRFRFHLKQGSLYAFWVSPDESGASHGYVAAGGPGFTGPTDTVGRAGQAR